MSKRLSIIFALTVLTPSVFAQNTFQFVHKSCEIKIPTNTPLTKTLKNMLVSRGFKVLMASNNNENIFPEDLYATVEKKLVKDGLLWKPCFVEVKINQSRRGRVFDNDETVYKKSSTRKFPRITFQGEERCRRALQDNFIHIPKCKTP